MNCLHTNCPNNKKPDGEREEQPPTPHGTRRLCAFCGQVLGRCSKSSGVGQVRANSRIGVGVLHRAAKAKI